MDSAPCCANARCDRDLRGGNARDYRVNPYGRAVWNRPADGRNRSSSKASGAAPRACEAAPPSAPRSQEAAPPPAPRARQAAPSPTPRPRKAASLSAFRLCEAALPGIGGSLARLAPKAGAVVLAVFLLIAAFQLAEIYLGKQPESSLTVPALPATGPQAEAAASTPRDQWRAGDVPFLYQTDGAWADAPYAGSDVAEAGCGPTSLAMVYVALTGKTDLDPAAMAAFGEQGGYVEDGLTAWRLMTDGAAELGLSSREVPADESALTAQLVAGHPVICSVGPGDFTEKGHFIVLAGMAEDGRVVVHDPNSAERSAQTWDASRVLSQCRNLWAFERA